MGRLTARPRLRGIHISMKTVRNWLLPGLVASALIFGLHPSVTADTAPSSSELATYLTSHQLAIGSQVVDGYSQIYYTYNDKQIFVTSTGYNHVYASASGPYVTWEGVFGEGGQIYQYNVLTQALVRLSDSGTNSEPFIFANQVVWRSWDGHYWQIKYYDGSSVQQITNDAVSSVRPSTNGQKIIYAKQRGVNDWLAMSYDVASGQTGTLKQGDEATTAYPAFGPNSTVNTSFLPL